MKHAASFLYLCGLLLLGAAIYVFAPALRHRVETKLQAPAPPTLAIAQPATAPVAAPQPAPVAPAKKTEAKPKPAFAPQRGPQFRPAYDPSAAGEPVHYGTGPAPASLPPAPVPVGPLPTNRLQPIEHKQVFYLSPGQGVEVKNPRYVNVKFHAISAISIDSGSCHVPYVFDFTCQTTEPVIEIRDARARVAGDTNAVTITFDDPD